MQHRLAVDFKLLLGSGGKTGRTGRRAGEQSKMLNSVTSFDEMQSLLNCAGEPALCAPRMFCYL